MDRDPDDVGDIQQDKKAEAENEPRLDPVESLLAVLKVSELL